MKKTAGDDPTLAGHDREFTGKRRRLAGAWTYGNLRHAGALDRRRHQVHRDWVYDDEPRFNANGPLVTLPYTSSATTSR